MIRKTLLIIALLLAWPITGQAFDLTGEWRSNSGATYYIRQTGISIFWYGETEAKKPDWSNVFYGKIKGNEIHGVWADVPKGKARSSGELILRIGQDDNRLTAVRRTGGFGDKSWSHMGRKSVKVIAVPVQPNPFPRIKSQPEPRPQVKGQTQLAQSTTIGEDCISFNTDNATVKNTRGSWKIVDGRQWLFDFGGNRDDAEQALWIIKRYSLNQTCFVGRPDPSMTYMVNRRDQHLSIPYGSFDGEDCLRFDPVNARVVKRRGTWRVADGDMSLFAFGNNKAEARQVLTIMHKYQFTHQCFVGRPNPPFTYFRR